MDHRSHSAAEAAGSRTVADDLRPVDPSRRRLVRSGLGGSVVLGSLVSKPVLGAQYICTVSGHTSGNASAHMTVGVDCSVGESLTYWGNLSTWPLPFVRGGLPNSSSCNFSSGPGAKGTVFNGFTAGGVALAAKFFYSTGTGSGCLVGTTGGSGYDAASMRQVLLTTDAAEPFRLGRATVVSLLNTTLPVSYPVSQQRIIEMFNAVVDGGVYHVEGANLNLTRLGVIEYLEKLYA